MLNFFSTCNQIEKEDRLQLEKTYHIELHQLQHKLLMDFIILRIETTLRNEANLRKDNYSNVYYLDDEAIFVRIQEEFDRFCDEYIHTNYDPNCFADLLINTSPDYESLKLEQEFSKWREEHVQTYLSALEGSLLARYKYLEEIKAAFILFLEEKMPCVPRHGGYVYAYA